MDNQDQVLLRKMFAGAPQAEGSGITSGLMEVAQATEQLDQSIDNAEDYAGVMNALRGDDKSVDERRTELAGFVGRKDANETPESVLTLIQPTISMMEMAEGAVPEGGINMQAPRQEEAVARMAMGEEPVKKFEGGLINAGVDLPTGQTQTTTQQDILQSLLGDVPKAQTAEQLLPQYQALYGDAGKAYELNPYIAGLNLAAAVANAPKGGLLSAVLDPNTIKSVSDPILQMAKAKSQSDLLARKGAMEAAQASRKSEAEAKRAYTVAAIPKLMEKGNVTTQKIGNSVIIIDEDEARRASKAGIPYTPQTIDGPDEFSTISLGDGLTATTNKQTGDVTYGGSRVSEYKQLETKGGEIIAYNTTNPSDFKVVRPGQGQIVGNAKDGFIRLQDGTATLLQIEGYDYPGTDKRTELMKNAERLGELQAIATPTVAQVAELKALTKQLIPTEKGTEFQEVLGSYLDNYRSELASADIGLSQDQIDAKVASVEAEMLKNFITAKTTKPGGQYDPQSALKDSFAKSLTKSNDALVESAATANLLANEAQVISSLSGQDVGQFEGGLTGRIRATVGRFAKETGLEEALADALGMEVADLQSKVYGGNTDIAQVQEALGDAMVVKMAGAFPGNLNQTEIDILKTAALGLGKSPEANEILSELLTSIAERQTNLSKTMNSWLSDNSNLDTIKLKIGYDAEKARLDAEYADPDTNPQLKVLKERADRIAGQQNQFKTPQDVINNWEAFKKANPTVTGDKPPTEAQAQIILDAL